MKTRLHTWKIREESDGMIVSAYITPDYDTTPDDSECYDESDIQAWRNDKWEYVGIVVEVHKNGILLGDASIWGTEYGYSAEWSVSDADIEKNDYLPQLADEALSEARTTLAKLNA